MQSEKCFAQGGRVIALNNNHMEDLTVRSNLFIIGITAGGWTYGALSAISFTETDGDKTGERASIYNNTAYCFGFGGRGDIYEAVIARRWNTAARPRTLRFAQSVTASSPDLSAAPGAVWDPP